MRTAWIAVVLSVIACKSDDPAPKPVPPPPPEPRIPGGPVPVMLPATDAKLARRVQAATAFVTIDKDGVLAHGQIVAGPTPYAGKPLEAGTLDYALFAPRPTPDPTAVATGSGSASGSAAGSGSAYTMKGTPDHAARQAAIEAAAARQAAIDAARNAGVLGPTTLQQGGAFASLTGTGDVSSGLDDTDVYGGLLGSDSGAMTGGYGFGRAGFGPSGGPPVRIHATYETIGGLDVLILADAAGHAMTTVDVFDQLAARRGGLAVEGAGAPDAVRYRFGPTPEDPAAPELILQFTATTTIIVTDLTAAAAARPSAARVPVEIPLVAGAVDRDKLLAALRPDPLVPLRSSAELVLDAETTIQQLVDALGVLGSAGVRTLVVQAPNTEGGTGWGTIGTGRYGTIGRGAGTGASRAPRAHDPNAPKVTLGHPGSVGDLDKAIVRRYIKRRIQKILYCYEKQLLVKPKLAGTVATEFFITPNGSVASSTATGVDPEVASCIAATIKRIEFPKPKGGGGVLVKYPFTFKPSG